MSYSSTILATSGLVAYWRLGESSGTNAADSQGTYPGTYSGSPTLGATGLIFGDANTSVFFDGVNDQIVIPANAALAPNLGAGGAITVECWVKMPAVPVGAWQIISKQDDISGFEWFLSIGFPSAGVVQWCACNQGGSAIASHTVTLGDTHHIVGVYSVASGRISQVYVDGVPGIAGTGTGNTVASGSAVGIANYDGGTDFTSATIDEVALYNVALSAATIRAHYLLGVDVGLTLPVQGMLDARLMTQGYDQSAVAPPSSGHSSKGLVMVGTG